MVFFYMDDTVHDSIMPLSTRAVKDWGRLAAPETRDTEGVMKTFLPEKFDASLFVIVFLQLPATFVFST